MSQYELLPLRHLYGKDNLSLTSQRSRVASCFAVARYLGICTRNDLSHSAGLAQNADHHYVGGNVFCFPIEDLLCFLSVYSALIHECNTVNAIMYKKKWSKILAVGFSALLGSQTKLECFEIQ